MAAKPYDLMYLVEACIKALEEMEAFYRSDKAKCATRLEKAHSILMAITLLERIDHLDGNNEINIPAAFGFIGAHLHEWWD